MTKSLQQAIECDGSNVQEVLQQLRQQQIVLQKNISDVVPETLVTVVTVRDRKGTLRHSTLLNSGGSDIMIMYSALPQGITLYTYQSTKFSTTAGAFTSNCNFGNTKKKGQYDYNLERLFLIAN